jgi:6-phosphogluconolactonase
MPKLFIGTYTEPMPHVRGEAEGIYAATMDETSGRVAITGVITGPRNPSYVSVSPGGERIYSVQETFAGDDPRLFAFALDGSGTLASLLGSVASRGGEPCHVTLDPKGRFVFVANYGSGSVAAFPLDRDGAIVDAPTIVQHRGSGPNPRQDGPRMHAVLPDASGEHAVVCDLGTDTVATYPVSDDGIDGARTVSEFHPEPGSGPRQLAFSPDGKHLFVVNEFTARVDSLTYTAGKLAPVDSAVMLPEDWRGDNLAAAVVIHPNGRFGYASNRGHDSIAIFSIDPEGRLGVLGWQSEAVEFPRDIAIDPGGRFLLVANQNRQEIVSYAIDAGTAMLAPTGEALSVASPSCIAFVH